MIKIRENTVQGEVSTVACENNEFVIAGGCSSNSLLS